MKSFKKVRSIVEGLSLSMSSVNYLKVKYRLLEGTFRHALAHAPFLGGQKLVKATLLVSRSPEREKAIQIVRKEQLNHKMGAGGSKSRPGTGNEEQRFLLIMIKLDLQPFFFQNHGFYRP